MKRLLHPVVLIALLNLVILQTVATLHLQEAARPLAAESPRFDGPSVDDYVEGVVHELNGEVPGVSLTPAQAARLWAGLDSVRAGLLRLPGGESRALGLFERTLTERQKRRIRDAAWRRQPRSTAPGPMLEALATMLVSPR